MVVIIPHPTEELKIIRLQKELISKLNKNGDVWVRNFPLWIELPEQIFAKKVPETTADLKEFAKKIQKVEIGELKFEEDRVYVEISALIELVEIKPVETKPVEITTTLLLLKKMVVSTSSTTANSSTTSLIEPVEIKSVETTLPKSLNIFRIGLCQCEPAQTLHNSGTSIQCGQTCTYVLKDSVWFKKSK